jgi:hypothetical protein
MFENFLDHCRAQWKSSPARAVAGESSAWSYCVPLLRAAPSYRRVTDVLRLGKILELERGNARENADPERGPHSGGSFSRKRLIMKGIPLPTSSSCPSLITEVQIVEVYVVGLLLVIAVLLIVKGDAVPARSGPMAEGPVKGVGYSVQSNGLI